MSKDLVEQVAATGIVAYASQHNAFTDYAQEVGVSSGAYISFNGDTGVWADGKRQLIEPGTALVFDIENALRGWIGWKSRKPIHTLLVPFLGNEKPARKEELPEIVIEPGTTDGWREVIRLPVYFAEGSPAYDLTLPSETPWRPINRLVKDFGERARFNLDDDQRWKVPLVEIGSESFQTKQGATKYAPVLKIVDWMPRRELDELIAVSGGEVEAPDAGDDTPVADNAPATAAPAQPAPAQPAPAQPAPAQSPPQANRVAPAGTRPMQRPGKRV
jgi:hypothetical protein